MTQYQHEPQTSNSLRYTIRMYGGCGYEFLSGVYCTRDSGHDGGCGVPVGEQRVSCPHSDGPTRDVCPICQNEWATQKSEYTLASWIKTLTYLMIFLVLIEWAYG